MKYCYKDFCITGTSILLGLFLALILLIVYSRNQFILVNESKK